MKKYLVYFLFLFPLFGKAQMIIGTGGGSGGSNRLFHAVVSSVSSYTVDMSAYYNLYDDIEIEIINYTPSVNAQELDVNFSDDGTTFDATAAHYAWAHQYLNSASATANGQVSTGDTKIKLVAAASNLATSSNNATFHVYGTSDATRFQSMKYEWDYVANTSDQGTLRGSGRRLVAGTLKAVKFTPQSGTMSFTINVYGL